MDECFYCYNDAGLRCATCKRRFCKHHGRSTGGEEGECHSCERERKEREVPSAEKILARARVPGLSQAFNKFDIADKPDQPGNPRQGR